MPYIGLQEAESDNFQANKFGSICRHGVVGARHSATRSSGVSVSRGAASATLACPMPPSELVWSDARLSVMIWYSLRAPADGEITVCSLGFRRPREVAFDADGERQVSRIDPGMVSKWWMCPIDSEGWHQSKIYTESHQSVFLQIFDDLGSMQILAIYRRLLVRTRVAR